MSRKIYVVTDLGPGDGGKGGVVHKIVTMLRRLLHVVIKRGGAQGSHGVTNSRGEKFNFSQWGCGTFEGVPTYLSEQMVVMPMAMLTEAEGLQRASGIYDVFTLLSADANCICASPYHGISSRLKELARGANPRGTIGTGVGEAFRYHMARPDQTIRVRDLTDPYLSDKLEMQAAAIREDLSALNAGRFLIEDQELLEEELEILHHTDFLRECAKQYKLVGEKLRVASLQEILSHEGVAVVECSHGVLTDSEVGLRPHVSAIRTLPRFTTEMLRAAGHTGEIVNLGVHRAYSIRHGAGPLPTHDPAMSEQLLPGSNKAANRWQGEVRVGPLDMPLLQHAIDLCDGPASFDGLCVTWFDQVVRNGLWRVCYEYEEQMTDLCVRSTQRWLESVPIISEVPIDPNLSRERYFQIAAEVLDISLGVPVRMVSFGPTELDKLCR